MTTAKKVFFLLLFALLSFNAVERWLGVPVTPHATLVFLNGTPSLPLGVYVAIPTINYREGDIVAFKHPEMFEEAVTNGWLPAETSEITFLKHIALPGTVYTLGEDGSFSVGGEYIGIVAKDDGKGHDLPQLPKGYHVVPSGHFLPYTKTTKSFDGRYIGPVPMDMVIHRVIPLFTY